MSHDGSACGPWCAWCGACTHGPRAAGHCRRCEQPYFTYENTISGLCDACLDRDHEDARIARELTNRDAPSEKLERR